MRQKTEVWPHGMPAVGDTAERSRTVSQRDIELFTESSGMVEVLSVREDKPITKLATKVVRDDGTVVLDGESLCYTVALP